MRYDYKNDIVWWRLDNLFFKGEMSVLWQIRAIITSTHPYLHRSSHSLDHVEMVCLEAQRKLDIFENARDKAGRNATKEITIGITPVPVVLRCSTMLADTDNGSIK